MRTHKKDNMFPQQRKLKGSSAQNSSVCTGAGAGSGSTRFRRRFSRSQVRFNRVPEKALEKVPGSLGAKPSQVQQCSGEGSGECQVQQGSAEGSGEGLGGFGAEPGQVQQGSGEGQVQPGSGEVSQEGLGGSGAARSVQQGFGEGSRRRSGRLWCRGSTGFRKRFRKRFQEAPVPSQAHRVLEKVPEKAWEGFRRRFRRRSGRLWCRAWSGSTVFRRRFWESLVQGQVRFQHVQQGFQRLASQHASERFVTINIAAVGDATEAYFFSRERLSAGFFQ